MNYTEMLNKIINESKMTNIEIVRRCEELGEEVTPNYLSILKNKNGRIPSENVSRVLAKACNAKSEEILVIQAYIDKAPKMILKFIERVFNSAKDVTMNILESEKGNYSEEEFEAIKKRATKELNNMSMTDFIIDYLSQDIDIEPTQKQIDSFINIEEEKKWAIVPMDEVKYITDEQLQELNIK